MKKIDSIIQVKKFDLDDDPRKSSGGIGMVDFLSYQDLEAMFGHPDRVDTSDDKVTCEWNRSFSAKGKTYYVDIYDWKATQSYDSRNVAKTYREVTEWHFGSDNPEAAELVRAYIGTYLNTLEIEK